MKIALVHNLYPPYAKGGAEKVVEKMAAEFLAAGHELFIITTRPKKPRDIKINEEKSFDDANKIKIYRLPSSYFNLGEKRKICRLFWHIGDFINPKRKRILKMIIETEKPELCITHNLIGVGFFLSDILKRKNIRHEHFLHDIQLLHPSGLMFVGQEKIIDSLSARIYQKITRQKLNKVSMVFSPSRWLLNEHTQKGFFKKSEKEIKPLRQLAPQIERKSVTKEKNRNFLFVGQIEKHKGILFLLKTFQEIPDKDISLKIIGDGRDAIKAKKIAAKDERISFLGHLNTKAVKEEMEKADALIVPSLCYENSPTVIYEARELSLPVIASDLGGIPEIVENKKMLFKAGNKDDLKKKL